MRTSTKIRRHLRGNVIGYVALFFAISGTAAVANHPGGANTITTGDIVNGQVFTQDIADNNMTSLDVRDDTLGSGGLQAIDLRADSVGTSEIQDGSVTDLELASNSVGSAEIQTDAVQATEIIDNSIDSGEIVDNSLFAVDLAANSVRASELGDGVVDRAGTPVLVPGGTGENGAYTVNTATAACNAGEELIGGTGHWTPDDQASNDFELFISEVRLNHGSETVVVDGGNDSGANHDLVAVATCLTT